MRRRALHVDPTPEMLIRSSKPHGGQADGLTFLFSSSKWVLAFCVSFRLVNSILIQTYFNPDEHWQSLEVAHRIVFGYGHLTWEWKKGIRSYLHPLIFAVLYKVLAFLHLDIPWFMMKAPRLLQSLFASFGDFYLYRLSRLAFDEHVARWALFSQLTNWFIFFCFPRTLSNSLETVLTIMGLYYWWPSFSGSSNPVPGTSRKFALAVAALSCAIRPTSAIIWMYVGLLDLLKTHNRLKFLLLEVVPIGALVLGITFLLDRWMYGSWIFVPLNFLKFNFFSSGGDYYGTHKWHWYFTQGFPVMLFTFIPFTVVGIYHSKEWKLFGLIAWVLGLYSMLGHKEFRFVLPVLPVALMFSGYSLATMENLDSSDDKRKSPSKFHGRCSSNMQLPIFFLLVTNIPMALYMSLVHQRGTEDVMNFLAKEATYGKVDSILFLMPCHATPFYSTLHHNLPMRFLDCSPRLPLVRRDGPICEVLKLPMKLWTLNSQLYNHDDRGVLDESDHFMMDPVGFAYNMATNWSLPSHIVLFDSQEKQLSEFLTLHSFKEIKRFYHAHFKVDRDLQSSVLVYALTSR